MIKWAEQDSNKLKPVNVNLKKSVQKDVDDELVQKIDVIEHEKKHEKQKKR